MASPPRQGWLGTGGAGCQSLPSPRTGLAAAGRGGSHSRGCLLDQHQVKSFVLPTPQSGEENSVLLLISPMRKMRLRELKKQSKATQQGGRRSQQTADCLQGRASGAKEGGALEENRGGWGRALQAREQQEPRQGGVKRHGEYMECKPVRRAGHKAVARVVGLNRAPRSWSVGEGGGWREQLEMYKGSLRCFNDNRDSWACLPTADTMAVPSATH